MNAKRRKTLLGSGGNHLFHMLLSIEDCESSIRLGLVEVIEVIGTHDKSNLSSESLPD